MRKIAFVPPWYGEGIPGGAEAETRRLLAHLHGVGMPVEVLTTCVRDFTAPWSKNYHRPGVSTERGMPVRRFPIRKRDRHAFDDVNLKLMHNLPLTPEEEMVYLRENVRSPAMEDYIVEHREEYTFIFIPYMFGTTYWGVQAASERAFLIPCLHDEAYARLGAIRRMFHQVTGLLLFTYAEMELARRLYGLDADRYHLLGAGVNTEWEGRGADFREKYGLDRPFLLYAGRKDHGKNVDTLIDYFRRYRLQRGEVLDLVLLGGGTLPVAVQEGEGVHDLGFVPVQDKYDGYAAAEVLCQPSLVESFSIVLMEAWLAETPVLVHERCAVTKEHAVRSNGGLYFSSYSEFEVELDLLLDNEDLRRALGRNGRRYVLDNYHWDTVMARYRNFFRSLGD